MCSSAINLANSCYLDEFLLIGNVYAHTIVLGLIIGTVVGVLLVFINRIKD